MKRDKPVCTYLLLTVNVGVFLILSFMGNTDSASFMADHGALIAQKIAAGENLYTLFTSMFLHFGMDHLASNMIVLIAVGDPLERFIGSWKFMIIYLGGGLLGNLLSVAMDLRADQVVVSAGASGAVLAVLGAMIYVLIRHRGPVAGISLARIVLAVAFTLYIGLTASGINNAAHIGGLIGGFALAVLVYHPHSRSAR